MIECVGKSQEAKKRWEEERCVLWVSWLLETVEWLEREK